jgi:hypothetical protein
VLLLFILPLVPVLVILRLYSPDTSIYGASLVLWGLFLGILVALWPACSIFVLLCKGIIFRVALNRMTESQLFVLQGLHLTPAFVVWSAMMLVIWLILFAANPFPARSGGKETRIDLQEASWITSLIFAIIFLSVLVLLKCIGLLVSSFTVGTVH